MTLTWAKMLKRDIEGAHILVVEVCNEGKKHADELVYMLIGRVVVIRLHFVSLWVTYLCQFDRFVKETCSYYILSISMNFKHRREVKLDILYRGKCLRNNNQIFIHLFCVILIN